jgi:hypothetical protein
MRGTITQQLGSLMTSLSRGLLTTEASAGGTDVDDESRGLLGKPPEQYKQLVAWAPVRGAHPRVRAAAAAYDKICLLAGVLLMQRPALRLLMGVYLLCAHLLLWWQLFSRHVPCGSHY